MINHGFSTAYEAKHAEGATFGKQWHSLSAYITELHLDIVDQKDETKYNLEKIYKDTDRIDNIEFRLNRAIRLLDETDLSAKSSANTITGLEKFQKKIDTKVGKMDQ